MHFRKPMLAKNYEGREDTVVFPCYMQPKIDGVRCITDGQRFWSRNGKLFPQENLKHLRVGKLPYLVDGELSFYESSDFEDIVSVVKRAGHVECDRICFNVFDIMTDHEYHERKSLLKALFDNRQIRARAEKWHRLETYTILNKMQLKRTHQSLLKRGFEGSMIRAATGLYDDTRSADLLKWKPLHDAEFEIVAIKEAKGKDKGTPVFICETEDGAKFNARPMGSMEQRQQMWVDRKQLIGKMLTVEYQNLTKYGVPRFPRAKVLRDYE